MELAVVALGDAGERVELLADLRAGLERDVDPPVEELLVGERRVVGRRTVAWREAARTLRTVAERIRARGAGESDATGGLESSTTGASEALGPRLEATNMTASVSSRNGRMFFATRPLIQPDRETSTSARRWPAPRAAARATSTRSSGAPARSRPARSSRRPRRAPRSARRRSTPAWARRRGRPPPRAPAPAGWSALGGAAGDEIGELDARAVADEASVSHAAASSSERSGAKRWFTLSTKRSGTTLRPRPPSCACVTVVTRAVGQPVDDALARRHRPRSRRGSAAALRDRVLAFPRPRAVRGSPLERDRRVDRARCTRGAACCPRAPGRRRGRRAPSSGSCSSTGPSSFSAKGPSSRA